MGSVSVQVAPGGVYSTPGPVPDSGAGGLVAPGPLVRGLAKLWRGRVPLGVDGPMPLVTRVLRARGITSPETFLQPTLKHLHDPSLIPDLDRAAQRLLEAARQGEHIVIYGDYDVDGVCATAILYHTLRAIAPGAHVESYVPHRLEEGYGLNSQAIAELAARGARVIVSVDCGVTAVEPARVAKAAGVDLIITDHHNPPERREDLPEAFAIVHPRHPDSAYPFSDLCGAGVAYKVAWRLATLASGGARVGEDLRALLLDLLGPASMGVIADVVPLRDENRVIAAYGLARIRTSRIEGLRALVEASRLGEGRVGATDVGFKLGPRLNACGRMGHAREAVELLTCATGERARAIAEQLTRLNDERRVTEKRIFEEACDLAEAAGMTGPDRRMIVLAAEGWHAGVVGIVCSRLVERFHRPAILLSDAEMPGHGRILHGSGRSVEGYSLHAALVRCGAHLAAFGGHDMAAGLKCVPDRFAAFVEAMVVDANAHLGPEDLVGRESFDTEADLSELTLTSIDQLARLAPFGRDNPEVRLLVRGARVVGSPEVFGSTGKHLSVRLAPASSGSPLIRCVGWKLAPRLRELHAGMAVDVLVVPEISEWNGRRTVEPRLIDWKSA